VRRNDLISANASDGIGLVIGAGDSDDPGTQGFCNLNLVQSKPAAGPGDHHDITGPHSGDADDCTNTCSDRTHRERPGCPLDGIREANKISRRHTDVFGITAVSGRTDQTAISAQVMALTETMFTLAAEQTVVNSHPLVQAPTFDAIAKLYDSRSAAAHGREDKKADSLQQTYSLARRAVVKMIEENRVPTHAELEAKLFGADPL